MQKKNKNKKAARTVFQTIPYENIYANGVIETEPGVFTRAYPLGDINFNLASEDIQQDIFAKYGHLINSIPVEAKFQVLIHNYRIDSKTFLDRLIIPRNTDGLNSVRLKANKVILEKASESTFNILQEKQIIISLEDDDVSHVMQSFEALDKSILKELRRLDSGTNITPLTVEERLKTMHRIMNKDGELKFENVVDADGVPYFDLRTLYRQGGTSKEAIAPNSFAFKSGYYMCGNYLGKTLFLERMPNSLSTEFLTELTGIQSEMVLSMHFVPIDSRKASRMVTDYMRNINGQIADQQKKAAKEGYSSEVLSDAMYRAQENARALMDELVNNDQHLFQMTMTVNVFGDSARRLSDVARQVNAVGNKFTMPFRSINGLEEYGFISALPLCINNLKVSRMVTTNTASILLPYTALDVNQKGGTFYGVNTETGNAIVINRKAEKNGNALRLGQPGSGKSMGAKLEMLTAILQDEKNYVYVIDPMGEYTPLADILGGEVIELSNRSASFVNPMDINLAFTDDPIADKSDFLIGLMEIISGHGNDISPKAKSIIDRCVQRIYSGYLEHLERFRTTDPSITWDRDAMPTLKNLLDELRAQPESEAADLADILEVYATGSLSTFSNRSNIDTDARFVSYNIRSLGSSVKELALYVTLNDINNKAIENKKRGYWTYIYIDEFHVLLNSRTAASHVASIWKTGRHKNVLLTGITQNIHHVSETTTGLDILENCDFIFLNSLALSESVAVGSLLNLSDEQIDAYTNADPGCGLIYNRKASVPFDMAIERERDIYRMCSTSESKDAALN